MNIHKFEFNLFGELTYIIWDDETKEGAVIDPGMSNDAENRQLSAFISSNGIKLKYLLYTHLHVDHTFGHEFIKETYAVKAMAHDADAPLGQAREAQARMFHLHMPVQQPLGIDIPLTDNQKLKLGQEKIIVISVPGHSLGSVAFYCPDSHFVITGDALFQGSIGRTDLPGGNHAQLIKSIRERLLTLPAKTEVYPGHGPSTTIGNEMRYNPYI